jgi:hypothetical protein
MLADGGVALASVIADRLCVLLATTNLIEPNGRSRL